MQQETFDTLIKKMALAENEFFGDSDNKLFNWNQQTIEEAFRKNGFEIKSAGREISEKRRLSPQEISRWFDSENSAYGNKISSVLGSSEIEKIILLLNSAGKNSIFNWQSKIAFFEISL